MSGDPEQEYFADGMVEEITTAIARSPWLFVIARNSSFTYKGKAVDVKQVARELGVRYVLEGSVRKAGNRVRITGAVDRTRRPARISGPTASMAPSTTFSNCRIGWRAALSVRSSRGCALPKSSAPSRKPTDSLDAYDLYLRARWRRRTREPAQVWPSLFRLAHRALELDPAYAPAMSQNCPESGYAAAAELDPGRWPGGR